MRPVVPARQLWAWRELAAQGLYASSNPANAFFYLLTGTHALHLVGGLAALARTARAAWSGRGGAELAASVELCAIYWHFLLFVWLLLSRCSRAGPIISASFAVGCFPKKRGDGIHDDGAGLSNERHAQDSLAPLRGVITDWSSDQRSFKSASWGKTMMWIFLVSDTSSSVAF